MLYAVIGDAIPESLTGVAGDPARGRAIVRIAPAGSACSAMPGRFRRSASRAASPPTWPASAPVGAPAAAPAAGGRGR